MTVEITNPDNLEEIVEIISKTVKGDTNLVNHIIFNGLSKDTKNPNHLMIMEKSSEGKSYPALSIAEFFPKDEVIILASATPQAFKYERGILVDENYNPIQEEIEELNMQIDEAESKKEENKYKKQLRKLLAKSKTLIDLRGKWIIFKEPPDPKLLEMLYSTLSNDQEYSEHKLVNKSNSGRFHGYTVVLRGTPAVLICTARDETRSQRWLETYSRFYTISPKSSPKKYQEGMKLIGQKMGLPTEIYEENVINKQDKAKARRIIKYLIKNIKKSDGECFNPFLEELSKQFPQESGYRWRQRQRFDNMLLMRCLCYYDQRPKLLINGRKVPVITLDDLKWVNDVSQDGEIIPPYKLTWFKEVFMPCWQEKGKRIELFDATNGPVITGIDLKEYSEKNGKGSTSTKQIRETYLSNLYEFGIIDKAMDGRNRTRDVYWPTDSTKNNGRKSSLINISSFNRECVELCLDKYLKRRFGFEIHGKEISQEEVVTYVLSEQNVIDHSILSSNFEMEKRRSLEKNEKSNGKGGVYEH